LGQGRVNTKAYLEEQPAMAREIESRIFAAVGMSRSGPLRPVAADPAPAGQAQAAPAEAAPVANGAVAQAA
jgi:recombination protein RecA